MPKKTSKQSSGPTKGQLGRRLKEVYTVAQFDLRESVWSRKFLVLAALYGLVVLVGTLLFLLAYDSLDQFVEKVVVDMGSTAEQARGVVDSVDVKSQATQFLAMFVENEAAAEQLLQIPPLAIFHAWLGYMLVPMIVVLTSSDCVANEIATGSSRYALVRVPRLSWALGKLASQTLVMVVGIAIAAWVAYLVGVAYQGLGEGVEGIDRLAETGLWMIRSSLSIAVYSFAFVGMTVGVSQLTESRHAALAGALGLRFSFWVLSFGFFDELRPYLQFFIPDVHNDSQGLWNPVLAEKASSVALLVAMGFLFFALGHLRLGRRDA